MGRGFVQRAVLEELARLRASQRRGGRAAPYGWRDTNYLAAIAYHTGQPTIFMKEATWRSVKTLAERGLLERKHEGSQVLARLPLDPIMDAATIDVEAELRRLDQQIADLNRRRRELIGQGG